MANIPLSDGEWKLMNQLWGKSPATITQLTERLAPETGWTKHTIITMLSRLEKKGAVAHRENGRAKEFWSVLDQADACPPGDPEFSGPALWREPGADGVHPGGDRGPHPGRCRGAGRTAPQGKGGETP